MLPLPGRGNGRCRGFGHDYENDSVQVSLGRDFLPSSEVTADWYPGGAEVNPGLRRRAEVTLGERDGRPACSEVAGRALG